jgi:cardiolipin synthase
MNNKNVLYSIPNLLCLYRVAVIPVLVVLFFIDNAVAAWLNVILIALAGLSDFLDGYFARKLKQTTLLGKFLDSSSDKLVVIAIFVMLLGTGKLTGFWVIPAMLIILREVLISGVREFMVMYNFIVPISLMGKWKLTIQMLACGFLAAGPYGEALVPHAVGIGYALYLAATAITLLSGWDYLKTAWTEIKKMDQPG